MQAFRYRQNRTDWITKNVLYKTKNTLKNNVKTIFKSLSQTHRLSIKASISHLRDTERDGLLQRYCTRLEAKTASRQFSLVKNPAPLSFPSSPVDRERKGGRRRKKKNGQNALNDGEECLKSVYEAGGGPGRRLT